MVFPERHVLSLSLSLFWGQSVAELEQKWQSEVEEAMHGKLENNMPFFYDYHFNEVSLRSQVFPSPSVLIPEEDSDNAGFGVCLFFNSC